MTVTDVAWQNAGDLVEPDFQETDDPAEDHAEDPVNGDYQVTDQVVQALAADLKGLFNDLLAEVCKNRVTCGHDPKFSDQEILLMYLGLLKAVPEVVEEIQVDLLRKGKSLRMPNDLLGRPLGVTGETVRYRLERAGRESADRSVK